ncbi:MAG: dihydropteroate synthase [Armatimonadetes bacterium]|nr:dihydropteroate synthase [Armatimonadota bacterium]
MGILNVTDDSFSGDGLGADSMSAVEQAARFVADGADILDIGGESTRPGSEPVPVQQELDRVVPVITALRAAIDVPLSVDTSKPEVARQALSAGAHIINDINGLRAEGMIEVAAQYGAPVVIMHMQGEPRTMQVAPHYDDVVEDIKAWLAERIEDCVGGGIPEHQIIIDPGFGFGKTVNHNLEMLRRLKEFTVLGRPILMGTSRKSTIGKVLDVPVEERVFGTAATCAVAIHNGANIIRVHDVAQMAQVARMTDAILRGWPRE